jgi:ribonucleoside-diphosphate reductase beta chain
MTLWRKAKKLGTWDPFDIDLDQDRHDWRRLAPLEREVLLHLASLFAAGEESVTVDLLPLIGVIAAEGRLEEEIYLTSFLWEEAKHLEAFRRFLDEVAEADSDLSRFHSASYQALFGEALPQALERLRTDPSPLAQAEASVTYNMIVEGVLAETGYQAYHAMLERNGILPGMQQTVALLKRDESRHIAYGVYLLSRLVAEHGEPIWDAIQRRMGELMPLALGTIGEIFAAYDEMPFGLALDDFVGFATTQFESRFARLERARGQTLEEIARG